MGGLRGRPFFLGVAREFRILPAQFAQKRPHTRDRQAHNIRVATFDSRDKARSAALNGVTTCLAERLSGRDVRFNFIFAELREGHSSGLDRAALGEAGDANYAHAREDDVRSAGKRAKHARGVGR